MTTEPMPDVHPYFRRMVLELIRLFTAEKRSGAVTLRFKEGIPVEIEPHLPIRLDGK